MNQVEKLKPILSEKEQSDARYNQFFKYAAVLTMPLEGIFFFGLINGWPNLAEILKAQGVYAQVCEQQTSNATIINIWFTNFWPLSNHFSNFDEPIK